VESSGGGGEHFGGLGEIGTSHELTFAVDDGRAFFALGLGLLGHGADHRLGEFDIFELDRLDIDAPVGCVFFDDGENFGGNFFPLGEKFIEGGFRGYASHGGLGELEHGVVNIFNFVDGFGRISDFVVDDSVHFAGDVVASNGILFGNIDGFGADVDFAERLEDGDDEFPAWGNDVAESTHGVNHATLIFVDLLEGDKDQKNNECEWDGL